MQEKEVCVNDLWGGTVLRVPAYVWVLRGVEVLARAEQARLARL